MEYRVLSNAWLKSPKLMSWVYNTTMKAVNDLLEGRNMGESFGGRVQRTFKEDDKEAAKAWLAHFEVPLPVAS